MSKQPSELSNVEIANRLIELCAACCDEIAKLAHGDLSWKNAAHACAEDVRGLKKQEDSVTKSSGAQVTAGDGSTAGRQG